MRTRILKLFLFCTFMTAGAAQAASCVMGTFASYVGLGNAGCTIGGLQFSGFQPLLPVFDPITSALNIVPSSGPLGATLGFVFAPPALSDGDPFQLRLGFNVLGVGTTKINGATSALSDAAASGNGVVTLVEELCLGGAFNACGLNPLLTLIPVVTGDPTSTFATDAAAFAPVGLLGVSNDFVVDGGGTGTARLTRADLSFAPSLLAVPEPGSLVLFGSALLCVVVARSRGRAAV